VTYIAPTIVHMAIKLVLVWQNVKKYRDGNGIMLIPSFIKIRQLFQNLGGGQTYGCEDTIALYVHT